MGLTSDKSFQNDSENVVQSAQKDCHSDAHADDQHGVIIGFFLSRPGDFAHFCDRAFEIIDQSVHRFKKQPVWAENSMGL